MKCITDYPSEITGKTVIVRANFDVPLENGIVLDTTRIEANYETLKWLVSQNCRTVIISHQDRPDGKFKEESSLKPIIPLLNQALNQTINLVSYQESYHDLKLDSNAQINLLENLRFWPEEEANDPEFARFLSSLGQIYVNEAFANCHRAHASITGIPALIPGYAGINLNKEINILESAVVNPKKPLVVVIGGAKLETKEPLVKKFAPLAQNILVGGKVGLDLLAKKSNLSPNIILADNVSSGKDITPESAQKFAQIIMSAGTVIWNGTMGVFEEPEFQGGTKIVAQAVNETAAYTIIGGGDTETALTELNLESGIDFISSGGGAMLDFLSAGTLPGLSVLSYVEKK